MWCGFRRRPTEPKWYAEVITGGRAHYDAVALYYISNQGRRCIFPSSLDLPSILSLSVCPGVWFNRIAVWRRLCRGEGKREKTKRSKSQSQQQQQSELNINRELAGLTGWDPKTQRPLYAPSSLLSLSPLSSPYYCCSCSFIQRRDGRRKQRRPSSQRQVIQGDRRWKPLAHTPFLSLSLSIPRNICFINLSGVITPSLSFSSPWQRRVNCLLDIGIHVAPKRTGFSVKLIAYLIHVLLVFLTLSLARRT